MFLHKFMFKKSVFLLALCSIFSLLSCKSRENCIILDTDIGSSTDDLFAMQMLYRYIETDNVKLLGIIVDREGEKNAALADVMNTYYGYGEIPVGLVRNGIKNPKVWIDYSDMPNWKDKDGNLLFARTVSDGLYLDGYKLYRKLLAGAGDKSVSICSIGFLTCLSQLLQSGADEYSDLTGVELVAKKVKSIYMMGGVFGDAAEKIEYNIAQGLDFAQSFFSLLPASVDVFLSPGEVGDKIDYRPESIISDISWTDAHPIKQAYIKCECDTGQKMWDALTVIHAVKGDEWFSLSPRGIVEVTQNAETIFTANPKGNFCYQISGDEKWTQKILEEIKKSNGNN